MLPFLLLLMSMGNGTPRVCVVDPHSLEGRSMRLVGNLSCSSAGVGCEVDKSGVCHLTSLDAVGICFHAPSDPPPSPGTAAGHLVFPGLTTARSAQIFLSILPFISSVEFPLLTSGPVGLRLFHCPCSCGLVVGGLYHSMSIFPGECDRCEDGIRNGCAVGSSDPTWCPACIDLHSLRTSATIYVGCSESSILLPQNYSQDGISVAGGTVSHATSCNLEYIVSNVSTPTVVARNCVIEGKDVEVGSSLSVSGSCFLFGRLVVQSSAQLKVSGSLSISGSIVITSGSSVNVNTSLWIGPLSEVVVQPELSDLRLGNYSFSAFNLAGTFQSLNGTVSSRPLANAIFSNTTLIQNGHSVCARGLSELTVLNASRLMIPASEEIVQLIPVPAPVATPCAANTPPLGCAGLPGCCGQARDTDWRVSFLIRTNASLIWVVTDVECLGWITDGSCTKLVQRFPVPVGMSAQPIQSVVELRKRTKACAVSCLPDLSRLTVNLINFGLELQVDGSLSTFFVPCNSSYPSTLPFAEFRNYYSTVDQSVFAAASGSSSYLFGHIFANDYATSCNVFQVSNPHGCDTVQGFLAFNQLLFRSRKEGAEVATFDRMAVSSNGTMLMQTTTLLTPVAGSVEFQCGEASVVGWLQNYGGVAYFLAYDLRPHSSQSWNVTIPNAQWLPVQPVLLSNASTVAVAALISRNGSDWLVVLSPGSHVILYLSVAQGIVSLRRLASPSLDMFVNGMQLFPILISRATDVSVAVVGVRKESAVAAEWQCRNTQANVPQVGQCKVGGLSCSCPGCCRQVYDTQAQLLVFGCASDCDHKPDCPRLGACGCENVICEDPSSLKLSQSFPLYGNISGIAIDGNIAFSVDFVQGNVFAMALDSGKIFAAFSGTDLHSPMGVDADDSFVYVADTGNSRVAVFLKSGVFQYEFEQKLNVPIGIAMSGGLAYVTESGSNRVAVLDVKGNLVRSFGEFGRFGKGQFNKPTAIAAKDYLGLLYVVDSGNALVQIFNVGGAFLSQFSTEPLFTVFGIGVVGITDTGPAYLLLTDYSGALAIFDAQLYEQLGGVGNLTNAIGIASSNNSIYVGYKDGIARFECS